MPRAKLVTITDIVKFGNSLAQSLRANLKWSKKLRGQVRVKRPQESNDITSIQVTIAEGNEDLAGMARAFAFGSGEHATRGKRGKYKILPKNFSFLQFKRTDEPVGQIIRVPKVMHPGVKSKNFIQKSIDSTLAKSVPELKLAIRRNLVNELRLSIKQIGK